MMGDHGEIDPEAPGGHLLAEPPDLPDPDPSTRVQAGEPLPPSIMNKVELLPHPDDNGFLEGRPSGTPRIRGWFGFLDGEDVDTIALPLAVDVWPPTIFNANLPIACGRPPSSPRFMCGARSAPGRLACEFNTGVVSSGFLESDGLIWDSTGRVVAQSRQLALVPRSQ